MNPYKNLNGNSPVVGYEILNDTLVVYFSNGEAYAYNHLSPGAFNTSYMMSLAHEGQGLNTFIESYVQDDYFRKIQ
jgi:hypothetical protein